MEQEDNFFIAYVNKKIKKYWNDYKDFGAISAAIFTTIAIIIIIGYIINVVLNALQIKNIVGCSYKMGAALFSSTTHTILRKSEYSKRTVDRKSDTNNEELREICIIHNPTPKKNHPSTKTQLHAVYFYKDNTQKDTNPFRNKTK